MVKNIKQLFPKIENKYKFYASNRVAKGAQKWLTFSVFNKRESNNTAECIADLRNKGYQIIIN